jgi:hypothetical protein
MLATGRLSCAQVTGATSLAAVTGGVYVKYNSTSKVWA